MAPGLLTSRVFSQLREIRLDLAKRIDPDSPELRDTRKRPESREPSQPGVSLVSAPDPRYRPVEVFHEKNRQLGISCFWLDPELRGTQTKTCYFGNRTLKFFPWSLFLLKPSNTSEFRRLYFRVPTRLCVWCPLQLPNLFASGRTKVGPPFLGSRPARPRLSSIKN